MDMKMENILKNINQSFIRISSGKGKKGWERKGNVKEEMCIFQINISGGQ